MKTRTYYVLRNDDIHLFHGGGHWSKLENFKKAKEFEQIEDTFDLHFNHGYTIIRVTETREVIDTPKTKDELFEEEVERLIPTMPSLLPRLVELHKKYK